ncbi:MAG: 2-amino-4-hydroxy-6-hydroxymethyldihydropteridine diphosphokinase [Bacteroidetes bacterium]|nr:2-amino-4-hydroxy-6-hydroxymethyldihydropteridine diphosphokinase [Bacteroidota bacterium]
MNTAYLILGGNQGDRLKNINDATSLIASEAGPISKFSKIYVTAAWGNEELSDFYNQAVCINTPLSATGLLDTILEIEKKLGRIRGAEKWQARTIDIDILFYNNNIIDQKNLIIPHPFLQERRFVLAPLSEIADDLLHPILNKNIKTLLLECDDKLDVRPLD